MTGRKPEDFKIIAQRYIQERPEAGKTLSNKVKTLLFFNRIMLTIPMNFEKYAKSVDLPRIDHAQYALESATWLADRSVSSPDDAAEVRQ